MTTDPTQRLADLMASPEIPSIAEYAETVAATFPSILDAPEGPRRILRTAYQSTETQQHAKSA